MGLPEDEEMKGWDVLNCSSQAERETVIFWKPVSRSGSLCCASVRSIPELGDGCRVHPLAAEAAQLLFKTKEIFLFQATLSLTIVALLGFFLHVPKDNNLV